MKLPRASFKLLRMILLGYLHQGGSDRRPASRDAVAKATGVNADVISANNKALLDLGLVERAKGGAYRLTPPGAEAARALEFEEAELIKRSLGPLLASNTTVGSMLNTLRVRGGMDMDAFVNHVAMAAGEPRSGPALTGARTLTEMLIAAGLARRDGERLVASASTRDPGELPERGRFDADDQSAEPRPLPGATEAIDLGGTIPISIRVDLSLTGADLSDAQSARRVLEVVRELCNIAREDGSR
jgi:hypothetical protein